MADDNSPYTVPKLPNLRDAGGHWLYQPSDKKVLGDVAKLAVTLRTGKVPALFLDAGFDEIPLGTVGRALMLAPGDLGLPPSERRFVLARGTSQLCLAEIVPGTAGEAEARAHLDAVDRQRERSEGKAVVGWMIADHVTLEAREIVRAGGSAVTSTKE